MPGPESRPVGGFWGAHCPGGQLAGVAHSTCALLHGRGQGMHLPRGKGSGLEGAVGIGWGNGRSKEVEAGHIRWRQRFR